MTKVTPAKELEQYDAHKFNFKRTAEDKMYYAFLQSIYDENGELNVVGGKEIPEEIIQLCRVYDPIEEKEYLIYDVYQWGYYYDGSKTPIIHIQDVGVWKEYTWRKIPINESNLQAQSNTASGPARRTFKDTPESHVTKYDIPFTKENVNKIKTKCNNTTFLYVYDLSKSGRGGKDGKIGVKSWEDFTNRSFNDLMEGTYLLKQQYEMQLKAMKEKENFLNLKEKMLASKEHELETASTTSGNK